MKAPFMMGIEIMPDVRKIIRYKVTHNTNNWFSIYRRTLPFVYSIEIRNMDNSATIYISEDENPSQTHYDELGPKSSVTERYDPQELYANTSTGSVEVLIIVKAYSPEYIKRMAMGIMEPMPRNPPKKKDAKGNEIDPMSVYYYGTNKAFPPEK